MNSLKYFNQLLLKKSINYIHNSKIKINIQNNVKSYIIEDYPHHDVTVNICDSFFGRLACNCCFNNSFGICDHVKAIEIYEEFNNDQLSITKLYENNDLFNEFKIDFEEYIKYEEKFSSDISNCLFPISYYKNILIEYVSCCYLNIKNEDDVLSFINLLIKISYHISEKFKKDNLFITLIDILFTFIDQLIYSNITYKEYVFDLLFSILHKSNVGKFAEFICNYFKINYFTSLYIDKIKQNIEEILEYFKKNEMRESLREVSKFYVRVLDFINIKDLEKYDILIKYNYHHEVLNSLVEICLKQYGYNKTIELIDLENSYIDMFDKLKIKLNVNLLFNKYDESKNISTMLLINDYCDHLEQVNKSFDNSEFQHYLSTIYNNEEIKDSIKAYIAEKYEDYDTLMALVKKDTTGRSGIEYSNSLKRYKSNELIEYFSNVIINISNKRYFIDEQLNTILKILSILGTIRGGSLVAIKLTKLLKDLNNEQINKVIDKYIKMYLE